MFDAKQEALDEAVIFVLMLVERTLTTPACARRNGGGSADLLNVRNQGIGIVAFVRDHCFRMQPIEQRNGLLAVVRLDFNASNTQTCAPC